jgi:hypothetical protein
MSTAFLVATNTQEIQAVTPPPPGASPAKCIPFPVPTLSNRGSRAFEHWLKSVVVWGVGEGGAGVSLAVCEVIDGPMESSETS